MTTSFSLWVGGTPRPLSRPRFIRGRAVSVTNPKLKLWMDAITKAARAMCVEPMQGALKMDMVFYMPTKHSERWGQDHTIRPDRDNLEKGASDSLTRAGIWGDDCQISRGEVRKIWADKGGVAIRITQVSQAPAMGAGLGAPAKPDWLAPGI